MSPAVARSAAFPPAPPQYMRALEHANRTRLARAAIKRRLAAATSANARELCAKLILEPPEVIENMRTIELVMACRRVGLVAARRVVTLAGVSESKRIQGLTTRQREALAIYLVRP